MQSKNSLKEQEHVSVLLDYRKGYSPRYNQMHLVETINTYHDALNDQLVYIYDILSQYE